VGNRANIWFGAVLRGDFSHIEIGPETSVQENVMIHCAEELPTIVGKRVIVGHGAMLEGCTIGDQAVVGMGAIVLQRASLGAGAMVAAGAVVAEREQIRAGVLAAGVPAKEKKELSGSAKRWTETAADEYQELRRRYLTSARVLGTEDVRWQERVG
jgi:carbonic anhydrase/acetyltransferase-like protein (isoleucine patch superfamily)